MIKGAKERRPSGPLWLASSNAALSLCAAEEAQRCSFLKQKKHLSLNTVESFLKGRVDGLPGQL